MTDYSNKTGFAIGTGRCGTLFLYKLMQMEPGVASSHERDPDNEAFHRYCKWNKLPVDDEGFLSLKENEILTDLEDHDFSFEASPHLSLSVSDLYARFGSKFLFLVRRPDRVVSSFVHKGFYRHPYNVKNPELAVGYQQQGRNPIHTFFARISPRGDEFRAWNELTAVGKVAWFWKTFNEHTIALLQDLPKENHKLLHIEDLDHGKYLEVCRFLGIHPVVSQTDFDELRSNRPHAFWNKRNLDQWTSQEISEFEEQVGELAVHFGYEYRVANMIDEVRAEREKAEQLGLIPQKKKVVRFWRLRRATSSWLGKLAEDVDVT
jgi:hypothetical protein